MKDDNLKEWRRFAELTPEMSAQDRLQFLMTLLGDDGLRIVNDKIEKAFPSAKPE